MFENKCLSFSKPFKIPFLKCISADFILDHIVVNSALSEFHNVTNESVENNLFFHIVHRICDRILRLHMTIKFALEVTCNGLDGPLYSENRS